MPKECIFCRVELTKENRAKEHVVPQWLQKHLNIVGDGIVEVHTTKDGKEELERRHTLMSLVAGNCCEDCNGGWMSQLEVDVMPILKDLWEWNRKLDQLTDDEKKTLAFWAAKTAYALMSAGPFWSNVSPGQVDHVYQHREAPPDVFVFATHVETNRTYGVRGFWRWDTFGKVSPEEDELVKTKSYKLVLHFENLVIMVAYWPVPGWWLAVNPLRYYPLSGDESRIKWIVPAFGEPAQTTHMEGLKDFGMQAYALKDDVPVEAVISYNQSEKKWLVIGKPDTWKFNDPTGVAAAGPQLTT